MSWTNVRNALVAIPATITPTILGRGMVDRFFYDKQGNEDTVGAKSRRWWASVLEGRADGPTTHNITRHRLIWEVVVEYCETIADGDLIDLAIPTDASLLAQAFALRSNWHADTVAITPLSNSVAPYTIEKVPGARRLRLKLEVRYQQ
jgi:hypothetical protein